MYKWLHTVLCIFAVTPHAGVRIEIDCIAPECWNTLVTPHAGVRIEIDMNKAVDNANASHPPRGGAN